MAYIPKSEIQQNQLTSMNQNLLTSGNPTQAPTAAAGTAGTQNTAGSSAMALASGGSGGVGNQYTNFQDYVDANQGATEGQAEALSNTLGISDAERALQNAQTTAESASKLGVSQIDDDFLNQYLQKPFEVDQAKYGNLASIISGSGYRGPEKADTYYDDAQQKLLRAQENAGLVNDPYGLQTLLAKNPTGGATAGGMALDASLLYGNTAAREKLGQAKTKAEGLTGQFQTSQSTANKAIEDAKAQQEQFRQLARGKVEGAQQGIRTVAEQAMADRVTADQAKFEEAKTAANFGDFSKLSEILGADSVKQLQGLYGQLEPGSDVQLGSYLQTPESAATGYATGDVLTPEQQAAYQEYGNILNSSDSFIQAARKPGGIGFDQDTARQRLEGLYQTQEAAREQQRQIVAAQQEAARQEQARQDQIAAEAKAQADAAAAAQEQQRLEAVAAEYARQQEEARKAQEYAAWKAEQDRLAAIEREPAPTPVAPPVAAPAPVAPAPTPAAPPVAAPAPVEAPAAPAPVDPLAGLIAGEPPPVGDAYRGQDMPPNLYDPRYEAQRQSGQWYMNQQYYDDLNAYYGRVGDPRYVPPANSGYDIPLNSWGIV